MATWATIPERTRKPRFVALALLLGSLLGSPLAGANVIVPADGVMHLEAGTVDAACIDLIVAGTLNLDTGAFVNVGNVVVQSGGVLNGDSGSITLVGNFSVLPGGQYNVDASTVSYQSACGGRPRTVAIPVPTLSVRALLALNAALAMLALLSFGRLQRQRAALKGVRK